MSAFLQGQLAGEHVVVVGDAIVEIEGWRGLCQGVAEGGEVEDGLAQGWEVGWGLRVCRGEFWGESLGDGGAVACEFGPGHVGEGKVIDEDLERGGAGGRDLPDDGVFGVSLGVVIVEVCGETCAELVAKLGVLGARGGKAWCEAGQVVFGACIGKAAAEPVGDDIGEVVGEAGWHQVGVTPCEEIG